MAYVQSPDCKTMVHFKPIDVDDFNKRFVENNESIYCLNCFKKKEKVIKSNVSFRTKSVTSSTIE